MIRIVSALGGLLSAIFVGQIFRKRLFRNKGMLIYTIGTMFWFGWLFFASTIEMRIVVDEIAPFIPIYWFVLLGLGLLPAAREFLKLKPASKHIELLMSAMLFGLLIIQIALSTAEARQNLPFQIVYFVLIAAWIIILIVGMVEFVGAYRRDRQPLHRNRMFTWLPIPLLNVIAGIFIFNGWVAFAALAQLTVIAWFGYVALSPNLPDVKNLLRSLLRYCLVISAVLIYALLFIFVFGVLREVVSQHYTILIAAGLLILASLLAKPTLDLISRSSFLLIPELSVQADKVLRQFSREIRMGTTLDDLVARLVSTIQRILDVDEVTILNVERITDKERVNYQISSLQNIPGYVDQLTLSADDPICSQYLCQNKPLSQYQIDFNPDFEKTTPKNRTWFEQAGYDLFIPIVSKESWIGLICLGSKNNSLPYTSPEIEFMLSLSDQTAIAFENARLVSGLTRLNNEYRRAYAALERTNASLEKTVRQLEKLDRFKSDLITVLSHEIRTPMTLIAGYAQMLIDEPDILQRPEWVELARGITIGTERLEDIVGAILDMASIDAQTLDLSVKPVDIQKLVENIILDLTADLSRRSISVDYERLAGLPVLDTDSQLLEKALRQVLSNSIKYSPDGSRITIQGSQLLTEVSPIGEDGIKLEISDLGIGLDEDQLELVFEKFYQTGETSAHSSGKTKFKGGGPGLGLAIVKGIINELHGVVWAESIGHDEQEYPGTTIHIVLPLKREKTHKKQISTGETLNLTRDSQAHSADE
jgi:signal transduction histidine kinase